MKVLVTRDLLAQEIMDLDQQLLEALDEPLLHFYTWKKPSATYGHFIDPEKIFKTAHGLDLGKRPTGGGVIFHLWDFAFSLLIPVGHPLFRSETLESYAVVHEVVKRAVDVELSEGVEPLDPLYKKFCMAHPTRYDLVQAGKKIGGAAQRRTKKGILHQASLFIDPPDFALIKEMLIDGERVAEEIKRSSAFLKMPREAVKERLTVVFKSALK